MSDTDAASGDAAKAKPKTSGWSGHALLSVLALLGYRRYGLVLVAFRHERRRWIRMALLAVCVLFGAAGAVFFLSFGVILLFWGTHRLAAVAGVVLLYVLVGLLALRAFHRTRKRKRGLFYNPPPPARGRCGRADGGQERARPQRASAHSLSATPAMASTR